MSPFAPRFTITDGITAGLAAIERARGFLEAATPSDEWVRRMSQRALLYDRDRWAAVRADVVALGRRLNPRQSAVAETALTYRGGPLRLAHRSYGSHRTYIT